MRRAVPICILSALLCLTAAAQDRGTFVGTVTDPTGAEVPNVKVSAIQTATNLRVDTLTNSVGQYRVPNLPVGVYRLVFEAAGFKTSVRDGIKLNVTDVIPVDVRLELGTTTESLTVTAEAPLLQTETPEVGTLMSTRQVIDLPLGFSGGRYAENFAYKLTPGVGGDSWTSHINGAPSFSKEVVLDGASATIYISGELAESSPSVEAVQEFKVQTSGMSSEYTRTSGGVFNFVLKSGENQYHGSGMIEWHNESFDANTFANNFYRKSRLRDRRQDWALSLGGPVGIPKLKMFKDKWFFYTTYEKYTESYAGGGSPTVTVPLPQWYTGDFGNYLTTQSLGTDASGNNVLRGAIYDPDSSKMVGGTLVRTMFPNNVIPKNRISKASQNLVNILQQHYTPQVKLPDGSYPMVNNSFWPVANQAGFTQMQFSEKSDYLINSKHRLSGSFVLTDRPRVLLDQGGVWDFTDPSGGPLSRARLQWVVAHYVRLAEDWTVSPTLLNHALVGYGRQINPSTSKHVGENGAQVLGISGIAGYNYPEITGLGGDRVSIPTLGYQANDYGAGTAYEFLDTLSWIHGKHSLKFGFDSRWNGLNWRNNAGPGKFSFSSDVTGLPGFNQTGLGFASMLLGQVTSGSVTVDTPTSSQFPAYGAFVQDDWKVSPRLTVNLGLRWEYQPQGTEKYDRLHNFNPSLMDPTYNIPGAIEFAGNGQGRNGKRHFYPNCLNCGWGPRIGFAYELPESTKATIRGGYGIFYAPRVPNGWSGVPWGNKLGFTATNTVNQPAPSTAAFNWDNGYNGVVKKASLDPSAAQSIWGPVSWDPDGGRVGYTQQWNFNIQRELGKNFVLDLGYIGTKSTGLNANELKKMNQIPYSALALGDTLGQWINNDASIPASAKALGARYPYGNAGVWLPLYQTLMPYPTVIYWSDLYAWNAPLGFSNYQAFQFQLNKRLSSGLQFLSNYTFSKNLGNISSAFGDTWGMNYSRPMDYNNLKLEKSVLEFDHTHVVKIGATYDLPFGRSRRFAGGASRALDLLVGGWTLQYIGNYQSGAPIGFGATGTPNANFATNRPFIVNPSGGSLLNPNFNAASFDMTDISTSRADKKYIITGAIVNPATINRYARGNAPRLLSQLRNFPTYNEDASLQKNFAVREGMRVQLRAEFLNLLNRHNFTGFETNPTSPVFGQISGVSNNPRKIQFGLRADF